MIDKLVSECLDHVVGVRREVEGCAAAYRPAHATGNKVLNRIVRGLFGDSLGDMLSGYRVFSRRFVKSFPAVSREFEIETELTVHSLACGCRDDGARRLPGPRRGQRSQAAHVPRRLADPQRDPEPHPSRASAVLLRRAGHGCPPSSGSRWARPSSCSTSRRLTCRGCPTAGLALGTVLIAFMSWMIGLILDGVLKARRELARLSYLRFSPPAVRAGRTIQRRGRAALGETESLEMPEHLE